MIRVHGTTVAFPDAAHFDLTCERGGRGRQKQTLRGIQFGLVIGNQPRARLHETQRQIGFSRT